MGPFIWPILFDICVVVANVGLLLVIRGRR